MGNKSGTSNQAITTPQGGGSIAGIGETFSPDLFTGTGNFTVPITLPSGRNGFQPQLNLSYSTGNGNGIFGQGWNLNIPGVSRKTSKGVPQYQDNNTAQRMRDTFILSGAEDLVQVESSQPEVRCYRPRTEGLFAHIEHHQNANNNFWQVQSKDGLTSFYGSPNLILNDPAVVADPANRDHIFTWHLSATEDLFGNRIEYQYERASNDETQIYLHQVRYANFGSESSHQFLVTVNFIYKDRPDPFSSYRSGFEIPTRRRCSSIEVRTNAHLEQLTRRYQFIYLDQQSDANVALPLNGVSLLHQVVVSGIDENHSSPHEQNLPPLEFTYNRFEPLQRKLTTLTGRDMPPGSLARQEYETVDLFGNGLPDIIQMNGAVRYWRNLGNGHYDQPRTMNNLPAGLHLADPGVQLVDADGDGRIDLLATNNNLSGFFPIGVNGEWDNSSFQPYDVSPGFNFEDPEVKLVDLNGDGVIDAIRSGNRLEHYFFDPQQGWHHTRHLNRQDIQIFPNVNFSDSRIKWGDMSGDGLQDILMVHDGNIDYWPNMGHGNWGHRISMANSPRFPYGYDPRRILIGDIDGDGLADIVYVDHCKVLLWINQSGNGWSDVIEIDGTPPLTDIDAVRLEDMFGNGIAGVLWSRDANSRDHLYFLDFSAEMTPYLVNSMNNHMGAETRIEYASSTRFYLEDQRLPETRWQTSLPFPVQVIAKVEVIDHLSGRKLSTEYQYHHGHWDGAEREFRGFGRVDQYDSETFSIYNTVGLHGDLNFNSVPESQFSAPTQTKHWFALGPIGPEHGDWYEADYSHEYWADDPNILERPQDMLNLLNSLQRRDQRDAIRTMRGNLLRSELYALDGSDREIRPYTVSESLFSVREEVTLNSPPFAAANGRPQTIFFPFSLAQRTTQWERGSDPMTQFSFTSDYDSYGQVQHQFNLAVPRGRHYLEEVLTAEPYLGTVSITDYAQRDGENHYMVDRIARVSTFDIINNGSQALFDLRHQIEAESIDLNLIGQSLSYYDGDAFIGLPFGQLGEFGVLVRTEILVMTEENLQEAYVSDNDNSVTTIAPYLNPSSQPPTWTEDYPPGFREQMPVLAGYQFFTGDDGFHHRGYYTEVSLRFDFHSDSSNPRARGLVLSNRDALGHDTSIIYDEFDLLSISVTDPIGLTTMAEYDYRVFQPHIITDPNGNRTQSEFSPLGLLESIAVMGKTDENIGDTPEVPGTRLSYDLLAYQQRQQPASITTTIREYHINDSHIPLAERDSTIQTVEFTDGSGNVLQTRSQAEDLFFGDNTFANNAGLPGDQSQVVEAAIGQHSHADNPRVIVSGWQFYDNKGQVVERFEPFFDSDYDYAEPTEEQTGQSVRLFYDPRGQVIRTLNPDGSEQQVIYGEPINLNIPNQFIPTPWEAYTYDANDLAPLSEGVQVDGVAGSLINRAPVQHHFTPTSILLDALGRIIESIQRNRIPSDNPEEALPPIEELRTRSTYDIRGNLRTVIDALGRNAFHYVYDLANNGLRVDNIDAGTTLTVLDVAGNPIEQHDSKNALALTSYDSFGRLIQTWARDAEHQNITLRQQLIYADSEAAGLTQEQVQQRNLSGQLIEHYDEAGRIQISTLDFKGNPLGKIRSVISDQAIASVFENSSENNWQVNAFQINWQAPDGFTLSEYANTLFESHSYHTDLAYDALNRIRELTYPEDVEGQRRVVNPRYNRAGGLQQVSLDGEIYVDHIAYNAKGQRTLITYGNGTMTRYAYEPATFRLTRLRSERYSAIAEHHYQPSGLPLQDLAYEYDLIGNITSIHDRTPASGIPNSLAGINALNRHFSYDAIYRLHSATGREHDRPADMPPWLDIPKTQDATLTRTYNEHYRYDAMGNMQELRHLVSNGGFTRHFTHNHENNRLQTMSVSELDFHFDFDLSGNMIQETSSRHFEWNHSNQMKVFRTQIEDSEPSVHAHYLYNAAGIRVKKIVRRQGGAIASTVYIDDIFEHHHEGDTENNSLHIMDDQQRIAIVRVGTAFADDTSPAHKFYLSDHLGSSNVLVGIDGVLINREESTPYGETSFGSFERKRYRFTGKEKDEESGLNYHDARYYSPWFGQWISVDPIGIAGGINLYTYSFNNPVMYQDSSGMFADPATSDTEDNDHPYENDNLNSDTSRTDEQLEEEDRDDSGTPYNQNQQDVKDGAKHIKFVKAKNKFLKKFSKKTKLTLESDFNAKIPKEGLVVYPREDLSAAFDVIEKHLNIDIAIPLAEYYSGKSIRVDYSLANISYADTKTLGIDETILHLGIIYQNISNSGLTNLKGTEDANDKNLRAIFIASILFHEYIHVLRQDSTFYNPTHSTISKIEAISWASQYWFIKGVGGHRMLENKALGLFGSKGLFEPGKEIFNSMLEEFSKFTSKNIGYSSFNKLVNSR